MPDPQPAPLRGSSSPDRAGASSASPPVSDDAGHQALAHEFAARGLTVEALGPRLFVARSDERVHGAIGTRTDLSGHAAVFALRNPNVVANLLEHRGVPQSRGAPSSDSSRRPPGSGQSSGTASPSTAERIARS